MSLDLSSLLEQSSVRHSHLCPRQVLGARIGLAGLAALGLSGPVTKQTALVIVETDGCFADGVEVATGATVGHRTLRVHDMGKVAATFADAATGQAVRIAPLIDVRERALTFAPDEARHYFAQLQAYQVMPDEEMFRFQPIQLEPGLAALLSRPGIRVRCEECGEEIINERHVLISGRLLCQTCAGRGYYRELPIPADIVIPTRIPA